MKKTDFTFKFTGSNEIDINILISSLKDVSFSLQEISMAENGTELEIKVQPFKEGSFAILMALMDPTIREYIPLVDSFIPGETIIDKFKNIFEHVKLFKGDKIPKGEVVGDDNIVFKTETGDNIMIDNSIKRDESENNAPVFNGTLTNYYGGDAYMGAVYHVENLFLVSSDQEGISGMQILKDNKVISQVEKTELVEIARTIKDRRVNPPQIEKPKQTRDVIKNRVIISICAVDMDGDDKWEVIYDGKKVKLTNSDSILKSNLNERVFGFLNRDKIQVNLKIVQHYNKKSDDYINKEYILTKYLKKVEIAEQVRLFDKE